MQARHRIALAWSLFVALSVASCGGDDVTANGGDDAGGDGTSASDAHIGGDGGKDANAFDGARDGAFFDATTNDASDNDATLDGASDADADGSAPEFDAAALTLPQPRYPLSTGRVTNQNPTFSWVIPPAADQLTLIVCADRGCATPLASLDVTGGFSDNPLGTPLPPGPIFWKVRAHYVIQDVPDITLDGPTWEFFVGPTNTLPDYSYGTTFDANGDGFADLAVGAPQEDKVYVFYGAAGGLPATPSVTLAAPATGQFGAALASGDVNGDGFADLIVGAPQTVDSSSFLVGAIHTYLGGASGLATSPVSTILGPDGNDGYFGTSVAAGEMGLGAEGYADILVGAYGVSMAQGRAYMIAGSPSGPDADSLVAIDDPNASAFDFFGQSVAILANGVAIGAPGTSGTQAVYLFSHSTSSPTMTYMAPVGALDFGKSLGVGDFNGDSFVDLVVGAPSSGASNEGAAYVYLTPPGDSIPDSTPTTLSGADANERLGFAVASAGDVDDDGYDDIVVGTAASAKPALLYRGGSAVSSSPASLVCGSSSVAAGAAVSGADVNGDHFADIIVGAPTAQDDAGVSGGTACTFFGAAVVPTTPGWSVTGSVSGGRFGGAVFGASN